MSLDLKRFIPFALFTLISTFAATFLLAEPIPAKGGWLEVTDEELNATEPKIDPDAPVELLLRRVDVNDNDPAATRFRYYVRAKIFSEAGIDAFAKIDLAYATGWYISGVKARVVNPDGTITDLNRKEIYKRELYKDGEFESNAKSFSLPGLQVGSIVEYRWTQVRQYFSWGLQVDMRAEWPTWDFRARINPYAGLAASIRFYNGIVEHELKGGAFRFEIKNQKAKSDKPRLGARKDFEPFAAMVYAGTVKQFDRTLYWGYRGGAIVEVNKDYIKPKAKRVKTVAAEIFDGLTTDEEKLKAAYIYCSEELVNISSYSDVYTEEELEDLDSNKSAVDTLMRGYGTRFDINSVFASLCQNQGIDVYMAQVENRKEYSYQPFAIGSFNLSDWAVAARTETGWRFFDPGSSFLPFGMLNPENTGVTAIVADKKFYYMTKTSDTDASLSRETRIADVTLDEFGDLVGLVRLKYSGFSGIGKKRIYAPLSEKERVEFIEEQVWKTRLPRAEISNFGIRNENSREKGLVVEYEVRIPGYADVLGDRILFNPSLFEAGFASPFTHEERTEPVAFDYKREVMDKITFSVPDGFIIEDPKAVTAAEDTSFITRRSILGESDGKLVYQRQFNLKLRKVHGHNYEVVKESFDYLVSMDAIVVSLTKE